MISGSASLTKRPCHGGTRWSKVASASTGLSTGRPSARPTWASSSPKAGRCGRCRSRRRRSRSRPPPPARRPCPATGRAARRAGRSASPARSVPGQRSAPRPRGTAGRRRRSPSTRSPAAVGVGDAHVGEVGAHGGGDVGDERPRRGGPHQQVGVGGALALPAGSARRSTGRRRPGSPGPPRGWSEGRAAAPAVGGDPVPLVEQALVPQLAHEPPDRLDVVVGERPVGVGGVDPHAGAAGERRPVLDVAGDRLAAALVEGLDAVGLDLGLGAEARAPSRPRARPAGRGSPTRPCGGRRGPAWSGSGGTGP